MISFYPGPSRVHDEITRYVKDAFKTGILSINHRSDEFMQISANTVRLLKARLRIPEAYTIFYTSSATECWEIIAQSLITGKSYHIHNGAFGEKWFDYTHRLRKGATSIPFDREELPDPTRLIFDSADDLICLTQNETSNGTQVRNELITTIRRNNPNNLIAIDATSSMAGVELTFASADIWLASVQKCFGLPAGLGLMACSPRAIERAMRNGEKNHYNSLTFMSTMMEKWQTPFTPNVLNIYLLMRVLEDSPSIDKVHRKIKKRYEQWIQFFADESPLQHLVSNPEVHSYTVLPVSSTPDVIFRVKAEAKNNGILLGEGYGKLKESTFRIANFPAIKGAEIKMLQRLLRNIR